jgi:hypothetical protein
LVAGKHENKWSRKMPFAKYNSGCGMMDQKCRGAWLDEHVNNKSKMEMYVCAVVDFGGIKCARRTLKLEFD